MHFDPDASRQWWVDLFVGFHNHVSKYVIEGVSNQRNNADNGSPAKSGSAAVEEIKIQLVRSSLGLGP